MTALILDTGSFIAIERGDRRTLALLKVAQGDALQLRTSGGVIAEVWRGGSGKQANLAWLLAAVEVLPVNDELGRSAGVLIKTARGGSAIDATVVAIAREGDRVVTSDPSDIRALVNDSGRGVGIITC